MYINDFNRRITSEMLNEQAGKTFGYKLALERFSDSQLEDVRNKLRTECSQFEVNESFDALPRNNEYLKTKALLNTVIEEIFERKMSSKEKAKEKRIKKKTDSSSMKANMIKKYGPKRGKEIYFATIRKRAMAESIPENWIETAINRINLQESTHLELKAELVTRYDLNESRAAWILAEGEEMKADIIMASKDMVGRVTGWLEDVAEMKAEQFLELLDSIKAEYGPDVAQQYEQIVKTTLESLYGNLESVRVQLVQGLDLVAGREIQTMGGGVAPTGAQPPADLGAESPENLVIPSEEGEPGEGAEVPEEKPGSVGRERRESVNYSRRLGLLLSEKKN